MPPWKSSKALKINLPEEVDEEDEVEEQVLPKSLQPRNAGCVGVLGSATCVGMCRSSSSSVVVVVDSLNNVAEGVSSVYGGSGDSEGKKLELDMRNKYFKDSFNSSNDMSFQKVYMDMELATNFHWYLL